MVFCPVLAQNCTVAYFQGCANCFDFHWPPPSLVAVADTVTAQRRCACKQDNLLLLEGEPRSITLSSRHQKELVGREEALPFKAEFSLAHPKKHVGWFFPYSCSMHQGKRFYAELIFRLSSNSSAADLLTSRHFALSMHNVTLIEAGASSAGKAHVRSFDQLTFWWPCPPLSYRC